MINPSTEKAKEETSKMAENEGEKGKRGGGMVGGGGDGGGDQDTVDPTVLLVSHRDLGHGATNATGK